MTHISLWLSGENRCGPVVAWPSPALIWHRWRTRKILRKSGRQPSKSSTSISPLTTKWVVGLQYFSALIHPIQLFRLLHMPTGTTADSQGLSYFCHWGLKELMYGQVNWQISVNTGEICACHSGRNDWRWLNRYISHLGWKRLGASLKQVIPTLEHLFL